MSEGLDGVMTLLADLAGKLRWDGEDPKWSDTFKLTAILGMKGGEPLFVDFCDRFRINNCISGNIPLLFEQVSGKVRQILQTKGSSVPNISNIEQTCVALHLISLVVSNYLSVLQTEEVSIFN